MVADILAQGKRLAPKLLVPAVIILVGVAAFGLGRLSALKEASRGLIIYPAPEAAQPTP